MSGRRRPSRWARSAKLPDPAPGPGQVVVEAAFANITFVETQVRAGRPPNPAMAPALPAVLDNGVGGVVSAVGEGADPALADTRVVTSTGGRGGYAQRCAVPADGLIPIPGPLPADEAVALLADGRTALALADAADPRSGEIVLVEAVMFWKPARNAKSSSAGRAIVTVLWNVSNRGLACQVSSSRWAAVGSWAGSTARPGCCSARVRTLRVVLASWRRWPTPGSWPRWRMSAP